MTSLRSALAKAALLAAVATGLAACVATEPVGYYPSQSYYYSQPGYYYAPAPRPAYQSFYFSYRNDDDRRRGGPRHHHNRGRHHGRH